MTYDADGKDWPGEIHCHQSRAEFSFWTTPYILGGDSGGPLFSMYDGQFVVMGVASGTECTDEQMVYSTVLKNRAWLQQQLGSDDDGDGVADSVDNCPASRCPDNPASCANFEQRDDDGDSVGDVCDNCPPSRCSANTPGFECNNPEQTDLDGDGDGDVCDLCPDSPLLTADTDFDGVGNACDQGCEEESGPFPPCTNDSDCTAPGARCIGVANRRCTQLPDGDGDGIADLCDACPNVASLDLGNANNGAELREGEDAFPDACDPVPTIRVSQLRDVALGPTDGIVHLDVEPFKGAGSELRPTTGPAQMGFCSCFNALGEELEEEVCVGNDGPCTSTALPTDTDTWKPVTLSANSEVAQRFGQDTEGLEYPFLEFARTYDLAWEWREDLENGPIEGHEGRVYGVFMMSPLQSIPGVSARDTGSDGLLHDSHTLVRAPFLRAAPFDETHEEEQPCATADCTYWYRPGVTLSRPPDWLAQPGIMRLSQVGNPGILTERGFFDGTVEVPNELHGLFDSVQQAWVTPAESPRQTQRLAGLEGLEAAVVSRTLDSGFNGTAVLRQDGGTQLFNFGSVEEQGRSTHGVPIGGKRVTPGPRVSHHYVLSATQGALFTVGGVNAIDTDQRTGNIWRYDLLRRRWSHLDTEYAPPSRVLSASFDAKTSQLLVLSVDENDTFLGLPRAQLHVVGTRGGQWRMVGAWPFLGLMGRHSVAALEDGSVVIAASGPHHTRAWRFRLKDKGHMVFAGSASLQGRLLDRPVSVDGGLIYPLTKGGKTKLQRLTLADFRPLFPCTGL